MNLLYNTQLLF